MSDSIISTNIVYKNNPYYNTTAAGGKSRCAVGNPKRTGANVLCNCVGFAWGAYNETWNKFDSSHTDFIFENGNGNQILDNIIKNDTMLKPFILKPSQRPPKGGLIMWGGKRHSFRDSDNDGDKEWVVKNVNHVAFIVDVKSNDEIVIAQAGYNTPGWSVDRGEYFECNKYTTTRNHGGTNLWWYQDLTKSGGPNTCPDGTVPVCLGFLANPGIGITYDTAENTPTEETTTPTPSPSEYPSTVDSITQPSPTTVSVTRSMNGVSPITQGVKCYYKWGEGVSTTSYDGTFSGSGTFSTDITKPREATKISILPEQINADSVNYCGETVSSDLTASYPCVKIWDDTTNSYIDYIPYVWTPTDGWKEATPVIRKDKQWWKLYNTDSELV